jgi:hypothetical protein
LRGGEIYITPFLILKNMSCEIANGRVEACKDSISGIMNIYFINYGDLETQDIVYGTAGNSDVIETWEPGAALSLYKYELKGANGFDTAIQTSRDNGTTFFEQTLTVQLKKQDIATHKNVKLLAYGRPRIVVETRSHQYFMVGLDQGADVTAGTVSTGVAMGDFNGYNLTFVAMEMSPANFLDCATESELATLFGISTVPATIVAS